MRILAIRGRNLASLGDFVLELDAPPLDGAGLFAITGPTGAGKSTILDALCLSLFDGMPRLRGRHKGVPVGRPDEDEAARLTSNDVRSVLRRGAGSGFAEVDFLGRDGRKYRARWIVRRAREKPDGRFQPQEMELKDLENGALLGGKKTETLRAIQEKLGLTFDQFCRSALLAQGEFAAFLRASPEERADLLEQMTGTEIYGELSIAAHNRRKTEELELASLEKRVGDLPILDEATRQQLQLETQNSSLTRDGLRLRLTELEKLQEWYTTRTALNQAEDAADADSVEADRQWEGLAALRHELDEVDKAQVARGNLQAYESAQAELQRSTSTVVSRKAEAAEAVVAEQSALESAREARNRFQEAQQASRDAGPMLRQAEILDLQQAEAERTASESARQAALTTEAASLAQAEVRRLAETLENLGLKRTGLQAWLADRAGLEVLATEWNRWKRELERCGENDRILAEALRELTRQQAEHAGLVVELEQRRMALEAAARAALEAESALDSARQAVARVPTAALAEERAGLERRLAGLLELGRAVEREQLAETQLGSAKSGLTAAKAAALGAVAAFDLESGRLNRILGEQEDRQPVIRQARQLDLELAQARTASQRLTQQAETDRGLAEQATEQAVRLQQSIEALEKQQAQSRDWLAEQASLAPLAAEWPRWKQELERLAEEGRRQSSANRARQTAFEAHAVAVSRLEPLRQAAGSAQQVLAGLLVALEEAEKSAAATSAASLREKRQKLEDRRSRLLRLEELIQQAGDAFRDQQLALQEQSQAQADSQDQGQRVRAAVVRQAELTALLAEKRSTMRQAELVDELSLRRAELHDDRPCPLCGSLEHPWAQEPSIAVVALGPLRQDIQRLEAEGRELLQQEIESSTRQKTAATDADRAQARAQEAGRRLEERRQRWQRESEGLETMPEDLLEAGAAGVLRADLETTAAGWNALAEAEAELERLAQAARSAGLAAQRQREECSRLDVECHRAAQREQEAQHALRQSTHELEEAGRAKARSQAQLETVLAWIPQWSSQFEADPEAFLRQRQAGVQVWTQQRQQAEAAERRLLQERAEAVSAQRQAEDAARRAEVSRQAQADLERELETLTHARSALLDGQDAAEAERSLAGAVALARDVFEQARSAREEAERRAATAEALVSSAEATLGQRQGERLQSAASLDFSLSEQPWTTELVQDLRGEAEHKLAEILGRLQEGQRLGQQAQEAAQRLSRLFEQRDQARVVFETATQASQAAAHRLEQCLQEVRRAEQAAADILAELGPAFGDGQDWQAALRADPQAFQKQCSAQVEAWRLQSETLARTEQELQVQQPKLEAAQSLLWDKQAVLELAVREADRTGTSLLQLRAQRAGLLGGRPVAEFEGELRSREAAASVRAEEARESHDRASRRSLEAKTLTDEAQRDLETRQAEARSSGVVLELALERLRTDLETLRVHLSRAPEWVQRRRDELEIVKRGRDEAFTALGLAHERLEAHEASRVPELPESEIEAARSVAQTELGTLDAALLSLQLRLRQDDESRQKNLELHGQILAQREKAELWAELSELIGSFDGKKFRIFAQSLTLDALLAHGNRHLETLTRRYQVTRVPGHDLDLQIIDRDMADEVRSTSSLSGGESFLVSLALALGLSSLSSRDAQIESLFIDEGFGTLDPATLEIALASLDALLASGRKVGLISHVPGLAARVGAQIRVVPKGAGRSIVQVRGD